MRRLLAVPAVFLLVACGEVPTDVPARAPDRGTELVPDGAFPGLNTPYVRPVGSSGLPQGVAALSAECVVSWELATANTSGHTAHGNSFIACQTGTVTAVEIDYPGGAIGGRTLTMYPGNTNVGPAYTQTGVALAGGGWNTITLTTGFPVVAGSQYTLLVNVASPVRFGNSADLTGQWGYFSTWGSPQWQINHRVHIEDPNPTTKDPTETARAAVAPVEAATNPIQRTPEARLGRGTRGDIGVQRVRPLVECRGQPHEPGRTCQHA